MLFFKRFFYHIKLGTWILVFQVFLERLFNLLNLHPDFWDGDGRGGRVPSLHLRGRPVGHRCLQQKVAHSERRSEVKIWSKQQKKTQVNGLVKWKSEEEEDFCLGQFCERWGVAVAKGGVMIPGMEYILESSFIWNVLLWFLFHKKTES